MDRIENEKQQILVKKSNNDNNKENALIKTPKNRKKRILLGILPVVLIIILFCSLILVIFNYTGGKLHVEDNIIHYLELDEKCIANESDKFFSFFPAVDEIPKESDADALYYYRYITGMDYTYDVYAEWTLNDDAFDDEIARVTELFDSWENHAENSLVNHQLVEKVFTENYTCLFWRPYGNGPFTDETDNYEYYIFAYDESRHRVRYLNCASMENGVDQPYYLQLDW